MLILGTVNQEKDENDDLPTPNTERPSDLFMIIPIGAVVLLPFINAVSSLLIRQMRELSEYTISSMSSFAIALSYGLVVVLMPSQGFGFLSEFQTFEWMVLLGLSLSSTFLQILRVKAIQYEEPAKLGTV